MILLRPYAPEDLPEILGLFRASVHGPVRQRLHAGTIRRLGPGFPG